MLRNGCLIKPDVDSRCGWLTARTPTSVSDVLTGQPPPNVIFLPLPRLLRIKINLNPFIQCCVPQSAARVYLITKYPRSTPPSLQWPPKSPSLCRCRCMSEYKASISHIGKVIKRNRLHYHGCRCRVNCAHRIPKWQFNPCTLEDPCRKYIYLWDVMLFYKQNGKVPSASTYKTHKQWQSTWPLTSLNSLFTHFISHKSNFVIVLLSFIQISLSFHCNAG